MTFTDLKSFLTQKMRVSNIYEPLLIKFLLEAGGLATIRQLAVMFAANDESQISYYEKRLAETPVPALSKQEVLAKNGAVVALNIDKLSLEQKTEILKICAEKMNAYIASRGFGVWDYRTLGDNPIPETLRYRVLTDAKGRCALCGATRDETTLDVDHIIPLAKGGPTVYENLQVLCANCNRIRRDREQTDFHKLAAAYRAECPFCALSHEKMILENELAYVILDSYSVIPGYSLIIAKRHATDYFDISQAELAASHDLARMRRKQLREADQTIRGFLIEADSDPAAAETIPHSCLHLIPRRDGDMLNNRKRFYGVVPMRWRQLL